MQQTCGYCGGSGKIQHKCTSCTDGFNFEKKEIEIKIPQGTSNGQKLRIKGISLYI